MAFDDLTLNQSKPLIALIEALNSGDYNHEFVMMRSAGQQRGFIHLYNDSGGKDLELKGFTDSDTQVLKEEGYITQLAGGKATLKAKAYQQYKLLKDPLDLFKNVAELSDAHLRRLLKAYRAAGGSQSKGIVLTEVFNDENLSESDSWKEADYMEGEGWVAVLSNNGPPYVRLTHQGIKRAEAALSNKSGDVFGGDVITNTFSFLQATTDHSSPPEIQESLTVFRADHPDPSKVAFIMMRFGNTTAHQNIMAGIQKALKPLGITAVRADGKEYHDDLFPNVLTYIYGCGFGIAVFERIETDEFNPNVAMEVGYMFALRKPVCILKDRTLKTLHADLVGKLYKVFDSQDPEKTIPVVLSSWLNDKGLS